MVRKSEDYALLGAEIFNQVERSGDVFDGELVVGCLTTLAYVQVNFEAVHVRKFVLYVYYHL